MNRQWLNGTSLLFAIAIFLTLTLLINLTVTGARLDLTDNQQYTMTDGTKEILKSIDESLNLYFFFSEDATKDIPHIRSYAQRVREVLEEYAALSGGKIKLHLIDPEPFSDEEDRATEFGLKGVPTTSGEDVYFGLAATNSVDDLEIIPFFQPDRESFLEYELTRLVNNLVNTKKQVVGLISSLPIDGAFDPMTGRPGEPWTMYSQLKSQFDLRLLAANVENIEDVIDTLLLVHPKDLSDKTLYAIDQFVMKGGKVVAFVDPHAEIELASSQGGMQDRLSPKSSNLPELFESWGISLDAEQVAADKAHALPVSVQFHNRPVSHLSILGLDRRNLNREDIITSQLTNLNVAHAGILKPLANATTEFTPLIETSPESGPIPAERIRLTMDPKQLFDVFQPGDEPLVLAVRLKGKIKSAFANGAPEGIDTTDQIQESKEPINVVVFADVDMLHDRLWVRVQNFFGQQIASPFADNFDLVANTIDNLFGSSALIGIRGRGETVKPFDKVNELRKDAEQQFRAKEQELVERLQQTENRLKELQAQRDQNSSTLLSPEQEQALVEFRDKKLAIRKELRDVRHELDQDIDSLGAWVKVINIGLMPVLIAIFGLFVAFSKIQKRRNSAQ